MRKQGLLRGGGVRATVVTAALAISALFAFLITSAAEAGTTAYRGSFTCASDGRPLSGARIELWQTHKRWLPEVPPNFVHRATMRADDNGAWGFTITGGESNWRIRVVLVGPYARIQDWPFPWNWYTHTLRSQNNRPVVDYGRQAVLGYQCGIYTGFDQAGREYQAQVGAPPPQGVTGAQAGAPTAGVPFTLHDEVYWPSGYAAIAKDGHSVAKHEFAHVFRHLFDGSPGHFAGDAAYYWYLRQHSATSCSPTNSGFAFNEGWAEYWAGTVNGRCPGNAGTGTIERNVATMLKELEDSCAVRPDLRRAQMVQALRNNRGRIHSIDEFAKALGCPTPKPIKKLGKAKKPVKAIAVERWLVLAQARKILARFDASVVRLKRELVVARRAARVKLPCPRRPCEARLERAVRPVMVAGQLGQTRLLRKRFAFLADREAAKRASRLSVTRQMRRIDAARRSAIAALRPISVRTLREMRRVAQRQGADRQSLSILSRATGLAARGDLNTLAAMAPNEIRAPRTVGPTPEPPSLPPPASPSPVAPAPSPAPLPDLVIDRVFLTDDPRWEWTVVVRNAGTAPAGESKTGLLRDGDDSELWIATPPLAPGASATVKAECVYGSPAKATARADVTSLVTESDETNNGGASDPGAGVGGRCRYP